ncbi:MAG TPA: energy transducer TonB, partial [Blastocatellia bacterium]|nr:energy transducer TonB [Blastocatellia bacterium]
MMQAVAFLTILLSLLVGDEAKLRVAVVGPTGAAEAALRQALAQDARVTMIDPSQQQPALVGFGYDNSISMTTEQARRLGAAIGCDFFIIGKVEVVARSESERESYHEALIAIMLVDSRTGALAAFDLIGERATTDETALADAIKTLTIRAPAYVDRMREFYDRHNAISRRQDSGQGYIEDIPEADSPRAAGFKPPEFLNRVKPEYTEQADRCDVSATVEAVAVFRADGQVGEVTITRWAGFGLDEATEQAIRQLKFNPATRDGQPISMRASIRYNFRRVAPP